MKRIAVFCDGTWNRADAANGTNVVKLSQALDLTAADGTFQQLFYVQGVGTGRGTGAFSRFVDRIGGGAFGWGLTENIEEAYRQLTFSHRPGDTIYIFGFSRGAYTARSLAGLIRSSSIPPAERVDLIPEAIERYRSRRASTHPNDPKSFAFRHRINPALTTSPEGSEEEKWRREKGLAPGQPVNIAYLGVWDTVGALGLPGHYGLAARILNAKYDFHDTDLSRSVRAARHAVAVDERRRTFTPALWGNLDRLNGDTPQDAWSYRQEWFPGTHGSVGGGGDIEALSSAALVWIAAGAEAQGLRFDSELLASWGAKQDPFGQLDNRKVPRSGVFHKLTTLSQRDRKGPDRLANVHDSTQKRWAGLPDYRPKTLEDVAAALDEETHQDTSQGPG